MVPALRPFPPAGEGRFEVRRFRPNVVVTPTDGQAGFIENEWVGRSLAIGDEVRLRITLSEESEPHALGGVLVAHEVARALGCRGLFTERQEGTMTLRRGFALAPGEPVVVVEDVITTGGSTREVMAAVGAGGGRVLAVGSLVDRSGGAVDLGVPRCSLLELEVPAWPAEACPLCVTGSRPEKPGSRSLR